jgi:hypothetical protein
LGQKSHDGPEAWPDHQPGLPQRHHRQGRIDKLCRLQRRGTQPHKIPGPGSSPFGHFGQRGLSRDHRNRVNRPA